MTNGTSDTQTKRSEKPTYLRVVRFDVLLIRMIFVIGGAYVWVMAGGYQHRKIWKSPPESNEKRYFPVINKSKKKYDFFVLGVDK